MRSFFLLKCGERSNAALAGISKIVQIQSRQKLGCTSTRWAERQRIIGANQIVSQQKNSRHPIPQAEQLFKPKPRNGWVKGQSPLCPLRGQRGPFSHMREWPPLSRAAPTALLPRAFGTKKSSLCRENSFSLFFNTALRRPECGDPPSANGAFLRRFRDARRRSAYRRNQCPSSYAGAG